MGLPILGLSQNKDLEMERNAFKRSRNHRLNFRWQSLIRLQSLFLGFRVPGQMEKSRQPTPYGTNARFVGWGAVGGGGGLDIW